jgi:ribonuclease P protein component
LLPKERRLVKKSDFDRVFSHGRGIKRQGTRLIWAPGSGKAAVVVARSVGSTAYRNTIRRRWREALTPDCLPATLDCVLVIGSEAISIRGRAISERIAELLSEATK